MSSHVTEFISTTSVTRAPSRADNAKLPALIDHGDALNIILTSKVVESLSESARMKLPAIASHWLQSPERDPLILGKHVGENWRTLLSKHVGSCYGKVMRAGLCKGKSQIDWKIDFSGVSFPPLEQPAFTFIDLFAGIGGFRIAFQSLGGKCVFSSEWDRHAQQTYRRNFGEVPFGDIRTFTAEDISDRQIAKSMPDHDVLAAGFPCQPFSKAGVSARKSLGRKHGFSCEIQGTLFFDIVRVAKAKRPKVILLENVKHLRGHDGGRTFQKIKETIEKDLKYSFYPDVLDSSTLVPQRRERCYMVCFRDPVSEFSFPLLMGNPMPLSSILVENPDDRYTISDRLWAGHKNRTKRNLKRGAGFTAFEANPERPSNTLVARYYKDGKECLVPQPGKNPRKLTPKECARLQGFPDNFIPSDSDTQAYRQFGNSVAVPVVTEIAKTIVEKLKKTM